MMDQAFLDAHAAEPRPTGSRVLSGVSRGEILFVALDTAVYQRRGDLPLDQYANKVDVGQLAFALGDDEPVLVEDVGDSRLLHAVQGAKVLVAMEAEEFLTVLLKDRLMSAELRRQFSQEDAPWPLCVSSMLMLLNEDLPTAPEVSAEGEVKETRRLFDFCLRRLYPESALDPIVAHVNIGMRGIHADRQQLERALADAESRYTRLTGEFQLHAGIPYVANGTGLLEWLHKHGHVEINTLARETLEELHATTPRDKVREVLRLYLALVGDEHGRFRSLLSHMDADGRIRHQYRFATATTGRWSSTQLQNLARHGKARSLLRPEHEHRFFISDYSQIEPRVALWLCGHQVEHDRIAAGEDIYQILADELEVDRATAKTAFLAPMYGAGGNKLRDMLGLPDLATARNLLARMRSALPGLEAMSTKLMAQAVAAIKDGAVVEGDEWGVSISKDSERDAVYLVLPSGRRVYYRRPRLEGAGFGFCDTLADDRSVRTSWQLLNHAVQGFARDILASTLFRFESMGAAVVAHTHDEVTIEVPDAEATERRFRQLHAAMVGVDLPPGLTLAADSRWATSLSKGNEVSDEVG